MQIVSLDRFFSGRANRFSTVGDCDRSCKNEGYDGEKVEEEACELHDVYCLDFGVLELNVLAGEKIVWALMAMRMII